MGPSGHRPTVHPATGGTDGVDHVRGFPRCERRRTRRIVRRVRFIVELDVGEGRHVAGTVLDQEGRSTAFTGWLELLRLLEGPADHIEGLEEETDQ